MDALTLEQMFLSPPFAGEAELSVHITVGPRRPPSPEVPVLDLWCAVCEGDRAFDTDWEEYSYGADHGKEGVVGVRYVCRNCRRFGYLFALQRREQPPQGGEALVTITKMGETPPLIGRIPSSVNAILDDAHQLYLKGRLSERASLGIAAFTYYRRVVEAVWGRLLQRVIAVAHAQGLTELKDAWEDAKRDWRFESALDALPRLPEALIIAGNNPFRLLHRLLSDGVHNLPDEDALLRAGEIRQVLENFADRARDVVTREEQIREVVARHVRK